METWKQRRARVRADLDLIATEFPDVFDRRGVPLAIGIHNAIATRMAGRLTPQEVVVALARWTSRAGYLRALSEPGAVRHNLDGSVAGPVSAEHQAFAVEKLAQMRKPPEAAVAAQEAPSAVSVASQTGHRQLTLPAHKQVPRRPVVVIKRSRHIAKP
jgi:sRNA-binding protein